ncbi:MAG: hypothetical protein OXF01_00900, partial [Gemmatimonadetes bacterium]|nr:hypothetical protein [Gemmatimonadota bacterium]
LQRMVQRRMERRISEGTVQFRVFTPGGDVSTRSGEVGTKPPRPQDDTDYIKYAKYTKPSD